MTKTIIVLTAAAFLVGCASMPGGQEYRPIVDLNGKDPARYEVDLAECKTYAQQTADAAAQAVAGALVGALIGAILAPKEYRSNIANRGAAMGAMGGAADAVRDKKMIIHRCLNGRGYNVLG